MVLAKWSPLASKRERSLKWTSIIFCSILFSEIEELASEKAAVVFVKVDVDENEEAALQYNISAMPTFILMKNKQKVR